MGGVATSSVICGDRGMRRRLQIQMSGSARIASDRQMGMVLQTQTSTFASRVRTL